MRLTKTAYILSEGEIIGYNAFDEPIFGEATTDPFFMEWEPFSTKLAESSYGVTVDVQYRMFTYPNEKLKINQDIVYQNKKYKITEVKDFDKHYEVLVRYEGEYQ